MSASTVPTKVAADIGGIAIQCDVSQRRRAAPRRSPTWRKALGEPRILVNCAGIAIGVKTIGKDGPHPLDQYRKVIEINLIGTFNMIRLVADRAAKLEPLEGGERGVIVNTASVAAYDGQIGQAAYSASKGGVVGMTLPVARDLARSGIRVCTIAPGIFRTPMMAGMPQEVQDLLGAAGALPVAPRRTFRICSACAAHRREPDAERRDDPPRRRHPHGAEIAEPVEPTPQLPARPVRSPV